jgi:hypothetical protein
MGNIPQEVYAQVQFGIMVGDLIDTDAIFYNPDVADDRLAFKVHRILRDELLIARFKEKLYGGGR